MAATAKKKNNRIRESMGDNILKAFVYTMVILLSLACLLPLLNVLASSFSSVESLNAGKVGFWPIGFNVDAYKTILENGQLLRSNYRDYSQPADPESIRESEAEYEEEPVTRAIGEDRGAPDVDDAYMSTEDVASGDIMAETLAKLYPERAGRNAAPEMIIEEDVAEEAPAVETAEAPAEAAPATADDYNRRRRRRQG